MSLHFDSISDLPTGVREQAEQKLLNAVTDRTASKNSKQRNIKTEINGIKFDSRKEAKRYEDLMLMLKAGEISELKLQPQFTLQEAYTTPDGIRVRKITYIADFSYIRGVEKIVEDVKSDFTRKNKDYRIKKKMMAERFGIIIQEVL